MKRSETPQEKRAERDEYVSKRWAQLSDSAKLSAEEAIKYLLLVNAGAMAGALSFIGAMAHLRQAAWPKIALLLFVCGVILVGLCHAFRYHRSAWLFACWREDADSYKTDKIEWNDLLDRDKPRWRRLAWPLVLLPYASFACFLCGLLVAGLNFHDITTQIPREVSHGRTKITAPTPHTVEAAHTGAREAHSE